MQAAKSIYRNIIVLKSSCFALLAGIFTVILLEKGLDIGQVGLYFGIYSLSVFLLEVPTGAFADVYGRKKSLMAAFVFEALFWSGFLLLEKGTIFAGFAVLGAAADAFFSGSAEAHAVDMLKERKKTRYVHQLLASGKFYMYGTLLFGSVIGGYLAMVDFSIPLALSMCIAVTGLFYTAFMLKENGRKKNFGRAEKEIMFKITDALKRSSKNKTVSMLYGTAFLFGIGTVGLFTMWQPAFVQLNGWDASNLGIYFTLIALFAMIGSRLSGFFEADKVNYAIGMLMLWLFLMLSGIFHLPFWAPVLVLVWQVALGFVQPVEDTLLNRNTSSDIRATVISIKNLNYRLSFGLVGIVLYLIGSFSIADLWIATSLAFLAGAVLVLLRR